MKIKMGMFEFSPEGPVWTAFREAPGRAFRSDFFRKVAETFATKLALLAVGFVTAAIVARILGPEGRGWVAAASAVSALGAQFGNLGLHASNTYFVSKDRRLLSSLVGNTLAVSFGLGGAAILAARALFHQWPALAPVEGTLLDMALILIPLSLAYMLLQNLLLGVQEVRAYNVIEIASKVLSVLVIAVLIFFHRTTVEWIFAVGLAVTLLSLTAVFGRLLPHLGEAPRLAPALFKDNLSYGFKAYLGALFAFLVVRVDLLMVKYFLGAEQTGYYSIAVGVADYIYMLPVVCGTLLFPKLSAMKEEGEKWAFTKKVAVVCAGTMAFLVLLVYLFGRPAVQLVYGASFLPALPALFWILPGIYLLSVNVIFMSYFASTGMPSVTVYSPLTAALLNILLNLKLIPQYGIVGASISSTICYATMILFSAVFILRSKRKGAAR